MDKNYISLSKNFSILSLVALMINSIGVDRNGVVKGIF